MRMFKPCRPCWILSALLSAVAAQSLALDWDELDAYEKKMLVELKDDWDRIPHEQQLELRQGAQQRLDDAIRRHRFDRERFHYWQQLSDAEKEGLRKRFQKFQKLSSEERQKIREAQRRFEEMSPKEREEWRKRWESLPPEARARILERGRPQSELDRSRHHE